MANPWGPSNLRTAGPVQDLLWLQASGLFGQVGVIGRVGPVPEIIHETVLLGVLMDIVHQPGEVGIRGDLDVAKGALEEGAGAVVGPVEGLGAGVEQIGEMLAGRFGGGRVLEIG